MTEMPLIDSNLAKILRIKVDKVKPNEQIKHGIESTHKVAVILEICRTGQEITYTMVTETDIDALYRAVKYQIDDHYSVHTTYKNRYDHNRTIRELGTLLNLHVVLGEMIYVQVERYGTIPDRWYKRMRAPKAFEGITTT